MKTKNVFVEILYNISPSKKVTTTHVKDVYESAYTDRTFIANFFQITEALKVFGINEALSEIVCVTLNSDTTKIVTELVEGQLAELKDLPPDPTKISKIKAMYSITEEELLYTDLVDVLVNRISAKTVNRT